MTLSRTTLRGLASVAALAGFAVMALPNAQAGTTSVAATPPTFPVDSPVRIVGTPPPGDGVTTKASLTNVVRYNRLYTSPAITPSKCREVNVSMRTVAGVSAYTTQLWNCMYAAWAVPLKYAGAAYKVKPKLIVHSSSRVNTYCGVATNTTGLYCSARGGAIYIPASVIISWWKSSPTQARAYATFMVAHEYGHHVQNLTGILNASWQRQLAFTTNSTRLEESRRRELQASCLGAAYIGANKRYYPMSGGLYQQWVYVVNHLGDQPGYPRDHGSMKNHGWWSAAGFYAASSKTYAGRCNTWNANSTAVA
jgi:predicted metalloprotease